MLKALTLTLALTSAATFRCVASAQQAAAPAGAPTNDSAAAAAPSPSSDAIRYRVVIEAPREFTDTLRNSVDLVRWQEYADMTESLFDLLARDAKEQAREAVSTEGYFSPTVDVDIDRKTDPITVTLRLQPGEPTRIADVAINVNGPAASDNGAGMAAIAAMKTNWGLPQGAVFKQSAWDSAKVRALATLASSPYAAAKIVGSEALIDPATREAKLTIDVDSGPPFRIGHIEISGLSRYSAELVQRYSTIKIGDLYSGPALDQYLRRLNGTGYFASAQAAIVLDIATANDATIKIALIEAPTKTFESGVGYSTDTEFRVNASYRNVDIDGRGTQFSAEGRLESLVQSASIRFVKPPNEQGWIDAVLAKYDRTNLNNLITRTLTAGVRRAQLDEANQWQYGAQWIDDSLSPKGAEESSSHAAYIDVQRIWRRVDDLIAPTRGFIVETQAGVGVPGISTRGFGRVVARFGYWYPFNANWQLTARAEGGAVVGASRQEVPSTLLFRTGGDTTVRGYAYNSLGIKDGEATVPGRYYLVGSVELTRWINQTWGIATFVDTGNAFDNASDIGLVLGYGIGARVRTPIGPFRVDIAYGQESRQVRLHFSVGLSF